MTTTCNNATYAMYEKNVRGFLATQFGLSVHPYADHRRFPRRPCPVPVCIGDCPEQRVYAAVSGCETGT